MLDINDTTYIKGRKVTVTGLPYRLSGAWVQRGKDSQGNLVLVPSHSPAQRRAMDRERVTLSL